jgi:hypothetical protein
MATGVDQELKQVESDLKGSPAEKPESKAKKIARILTLVVVGGALMALIIWMTISR